MKKDLIINAETDLQKYQAIKECVRALLKQKIEPADMIMLVYLIEHEFSDKAIKEMRDKFEKHMCRAKFYRVKKRLMLHGFLPLKGKDGELKPKLTDVSTYLIYDQRYYKIGKSINVLGRLDQIKMHNPTVSLICYCKGDIESLLHKQYEDFCVSGEWFELPEEQVKEIVAKMNEEDTKYRPKV